MPWAASLRCVENPGNRAAITEPIGGSLAGTYWGESNIPPSLRSGLARVDLLEHALAGILRE